MSDFTQAVYRIVSKCPRGRIVSYGGVAAMAGKPRAARAVGTAMRELPDDSKVPWWRVVNSTGSISDRGNHGPSIQRALLEKEGVKFSAVGRIDWERFGWDGTGVK